MRLSSSGPMWNEDLSTSPKQEEDRGIEIHLPPRGINHYNISRNL